MESETDHMPSPPAGQSLRGTLTSRSFLGLLLTQLLGATNDNILRWLVIGIGKDYVDPNAIGWILGAGTACFVLPYLLLAAPAGYLADRFSKRRVIVSCKMVEIAIMTIAVLAILIGNMYFLFVVVAAMGAQSALFGPAKLGSIPEMLRSEKISAANGLIGLTTVIATVIGMALGSWLTVATGFKGQERLWLSAVVLIGVAAAGWFTSLWIACLPVANPGRKFPWDAHRQTWRDLRLLGSSRALLRVAFGIMFFWSLGALAQMNIDQFAFESGATKQTEIVPLLVSLVFGVGLGSVLAGVWSGGRVELGILPLGAGGVALSAILLFTVEGTMIEPGSDWTASYAAACGFLILLGISAGLFDVPLAAYMQDRSPPESRGAILAASNFLTFAGILLSAGLFSLLRIPQADEAPLFSARQIFLLCGISTIPVFVYIVFLIPQASIRFLVWLATHTVYRVRVFGRENLPERNGALLVANHVSWLDAVLLTVTSSRPVRILVDARLTEGPLSRRLARTMGAIPIRLTPRAMQAAGDQVRQALAAGELVCIFPEGSMTRSGQLLRFRKGLLSIVRDAQAPVIPVYLDELWGSIFSFHGGKYFWKWPRQWGSPVSIWFGKPMDQIAGVQQVRQAVQDLGAEAVQNRATRMKLLPRRMLRNCRKKLWRSKIADSNGVDLSGGAVLMRSLILGRLLNRQVLGPLEEEKFVGLLLPPSAGAVLTNAALTLHGRVAVNLNYTVTSEVLNQCIAQAGIRHVLTSRKVMEKLDLEIDAEVVLLEDFKDQVTIGDKLAGALLTYLCPVPVVERYLGIHRLERDNPLTVIFTSGSTGQPKGVVLTQGNVLSNTEAINQVVHLKSDDVFVGVLPFFHSFGYTVTLWAVLGNDIKGVYHFTPLEPKQVGKLCQRHHGTALLATPTFLRSYLRRCEREQLESLEVVVVGAEKMPIELASAFEAKFGVRPVEGYGATELSPLVSVNVPPSRSLSDEVDLLEGSVGRPVPGVTAKVVDLDTGEELPYGSSGMLLIKGPNVMQGYLGMPEKTAEVIRDGWYVTGDVACIDDNGFITITGRQSRFSKIGGEMVPHIGVEEAIGRLTDGEEDEVQFAVASVPDARKGERLVVLYTQLPDEPAAISRRLIEQGLPTIWVPAADSYYPVEAIPVLGTGKLDLQGLKQLAVEKAQA